MNDLSITSCIFMKCANWLRPGRKVIMFHNIFARGHRCLHVNERNSCMYWIGRGRFDNTRQREPPVVYSHREQIEGSWYDGGEICYLQLSCSHRWQLLKKFPMLVQTIRHSHRMVALNYNRSFGWDSVITSEINQDAFGWRLHDNLDPLLGPERSGRQPTHPTLHHLRNHSTV